MSNWDFGYGREPTDPRDPQYPPPPRGGGGPHRPGGRADGGEAGRPGAEGYPDAEGWPGHDGAPYESQAAPYPLTYERDDFDGRPVGPTEGPARPWQAGPRRAAARPTSPGRAVPQRPGPRQTAPWQATPPTYQFGGGLYVGGQPGYVDEHGYTGGRRAGAPYPAEPWSADYSSGTSGSRDSAGTSRRNSAGTMRPLYPDRYSYSQADEEPWLDDSRGPRLDGPWWDPDSWPGWQRWLIPVGVAVLAAAIGAALVLLTGMHPGASAAVGAAQSTASASPADGLNLG